MQLYSLWKEWPAGGALSCSDLELQELLRLSTVWCNCSEVLVTADVSLATSSGQYWTCSAPTQHMMV